jgi:hypothetical protein
MGALTVRLAQGTATFKERQVDPLLGFHLQQREPVDAARSVARGAT